ncbi:MAG TPA: pilin [Rhodanobacteraceae bacterium]|nr:pilin [Rhodanobacteraceae bacterium]
MPSLKPDLASRAALPTPPSLHWALLWLFTIASLGVFGVIWSFVQAAWVRRIDPRSNAQTLLGIATACLAAGYGCVITAVMLVDTSAPGMALPVLTIGRLLLLGWLIVHVVAYFSMTNSLRSQAVVSGFPLEIGGGTLFFFTLCYLQGQLRWLARWKASGQTSPAAPKGIFWILSLALVFAVGIVAAIALPRHEHHRIRAEVSEGALLADGAKRAMVEYYGKHHTLPFDNDAAGLARSGSISGRYVSSVNVAGGVVTVAFDTADADSRLRQQTLVFFPVTGPDGIRWNCLKYSTVPDEDLPVSCRK